MPTKTLVLKVEPDAGTAAVLDTYALSCSRWERKAFRLLYADKRHNGRATYGNVVRQQRNGNWIPNDGPLYETLIKRGCPNPIPTDILHAKNKQALAIKVGVIWANFQGPRSRCRKLPRPKGRLPRFAPVARFGSQMARLEDAWIISVPYPLPGRVPGSPVRLFLAIAQSASTGKQGKQHQGRLDLLRKRFRRAQRNGSLSTPSVEFHRSKQDGAWYLYAPVESEDEQVRPAAVRTVVGMDLGERSIAATATVVGAHGEAMGSRRVFSGLSTRHALHTLVRRRAKLQWRSRKGKVTRYAKLALVRMRGKQKRIDETLAHQVSRALVDHAVEAGATILAVEDLRLTKFRGFHHAKMKAGRKVRHGRRMRALNRWTRNEWSRGKVRDFASYKAEAGGIDVKEVPHAGTSELCPVCNPTGWGECRARDRKRNAARAFRCSKCGWLFHDDTNAAVNIARRAVNPRLGKKKARAVHDPPSAGGKTEVGSPGSSLEGGDTWKPQKPHEGGPAVAGNSEASRPTENPTTSTAETGAQANGAAAHFRGREARGESSRRAETGTSDKAMRESESPSGEAPSGGRSEPRLLTGEVKRYDREVDPSHLEIDTRSKTGGLRPQGNGGCGRNG